MTTYFRCTVCQRVTGCIVKGTFHHCMDKTCGEDKDKCTRRKMKTTITDRNASNGVCGKCQQEANMLGDRGPAKRDFFYTKCLRCGATGCLYEPKDYSACENCCFERDDCDSRGIKTKGIICPKCKQEREK